MDWSRIEKEISFHADNVGRKSQNSGFGFNVSSSRDFGSPPSKSYLHTSSYGEEKSPSRLQSGNFTENKNDPNFSMLSTLSNEISELRNMIKKQGMKLSHLENGQQSLGSTNEVAKKNNDEVLSRFSDLEYALNESRTTNHTLSLQNDEMHIRVRKLEAALQSVEDSHHFLDASIVTKDTFTRYLDTTFDQLQALTTVTDVARNKSNQSVGLIESLITALINLNNDGNSGVILNSSVNGSGLDGLHGMNSTFRVEFLSAFNSGTVLTNFIAT
jgi:hypothetical protein